MIESFRWVTMEAADDQVFDCVCYKWFMPYEQYKLTSFPSVFGISLTVISFYIRKCCNRTSYGWSIGIQFWNWEGDMLQVFRQLHHIFPNFPKPLLAPKHHVTPTFLVSLLDLQLLRPWFFSSSRSSEHFILSDFRFDWFYQFKRLPREPQPVLSSRNILKPILDHSGGISSWLRVKRDASPQKHLTIPYQCQIKYWDGTCRDSKSINVRFGYWFILLTDSRIKI